MISYGASASAISRATSRLGAILSSPSARNVVGILPSHPIASLERPSQILPLSLVFSQKACVRWQSSAANKKGSGKHGQSPNVAASDIANEGGDDDEDSESDDDEYEYVAGSPSDSPKFGADKGRGGKSLKSQQPGSKSSKAARLAKPPCNWEIRSIAPEVRVVDEDDGGNLGVMTVARGIELAKAKGRDLVLIAATATPPVAKITALHKVLAALKQAESDKRKAARQSKAKEMKFTARIGDHDMETKAARVIAFLREGRQVRVSVSFTLSAWIQEEPSRRDVMARLIRKVAESGSGYCDPGSLKGEGPNLTGTFGPCSTPRPAAEVSKALAKLALPIVPAGQEQSAVAMTAAAVAAASAAAGEGPSAFTLASSAPASASASVGLADKCLRHVEATAAAALAGVASKATIDAVLPPASVLRAFSSKRPGSGKLRSGSGSGLDEDKRDAMDSKRVALSIGDGDGDLGDHDGAGGARGDLADLGVSAGGLMPKGKPRPGGGNKPTAGRKRR